MTKQEAIKRLNELKIDITNPYCKDLWPYIPVIDEIVELFNDLIQKQNSYKCEWPSTFFHENWGCFNKVWYET